MHRPEEHVLVAVAASKVQHCGPVRQLCAQRRAQQLADASRHIMQDQPSIAAHRCSRKPMNGATPVPAATMMHGLLTSSSIASKCALRCSSGTASVARGWAWNSAMVTAHRINWKVHFQWSTWLRRRQRDPLIHHLLSPSCKVAADMVDAGGAEPGARVVGAGRVLVHVLHNVERKVHFPRMRRRRPAPHSHHSGMSVTPHEQAE